MYTNTSCTIYLASKNYEKMVIPHCFFDETSRAAYLKTGLEKSENAFVAFKGDKNIIFTEGKDRIVEGVCDIQVPEEEGEERKKAFDALKSSGCLTVMQADYKGYGSSYMRHWELSCR